MKTDQPTFACCEHSKNGVTLNYTPNNMKLHFEKTSASVILLNAAQVQFLSAAELKLAKKQANFLLSH
jgi:hypothetical protein